MMKCSVIKNLEMMLIANGAMEINYIDIVCVFCRRRSNTKLNRQWETSFSGKHTQLCLSLPLFPLPSLSFSPSLSLTLPLFSLPLTLFYSLPFFLLPSLYSLPLFPLPSPYSLTLSFPPSLFVFCCQLPEILDSIRQE